MTARVKLTTGPLKATFKGKMKLSDLDPPNGYRISGEGDGEPHGRTALGVAGHATDDGAGTLMHYDVKADVGGKLAQLGGRLINSTAKKLADEFFEKSSAIVGGEPANADGSGTASKKTGWFKRWFGVRNKAAAHT